MQEVTRIDDDSMPVVYPNELDQGLYGGLLGGEVLFMCNRDNGSISSMVAPLLQDWSEFERLRFDRSHPWFERYRQYLHVFAEGAQGRYGICRFLSLNHLNFVYELVGATETYVSLFESPDLVRRAIGLGLEVNIAVQDEFFNTIPLYQGGTFDLFCQWLPGRTIMESVDPFHMTSVDCFEEWGRAPIERLFTHYDGGQLHLHGNGRHLLEAVSSLQGLKAIQFGEDAGYPPVMSLLPELRRRAGDVPLVISASFNDFAERLDSNQLVGGVFYTVGGAPDADTAGRYMKKVRDYRW